MRQNIRFIRKGRLVELWRVEPSALLLDYLREVEGATGTKEGCYEGDCGACTVAVGRLRGGRLVYEPINACIQLLGQVDGCEVVTVEDLVADDGSLHPLQSALADYHASQCGYCTPGFVMSLFAMYHSTTGEVDRETVNDWIAGNLCRCTGYRPIVDGAIAACSVRSRDRFAEEAAETAGMLGLLADGDDIFIGDEERFFAAPSSMDGLADLYERYPQATLVAGATDVGLWITKQLRDLPQVIHVGRVHGLDLCEDTGQELLIGAAATYSQAGPLLESIDPDVGELLRRLGAKQVRASGTVGGNVANGSPIGDTPPMLIALDARIELRKGVRTRTMAMEEFFIDYGVQAREPGEFVTRLMIPKLGPRQVFRCYKVSKRFDQDISAVMGAFLFSLDEEGRIAEARIAFGGMAATPRRAAGVEAAITGIVAKDSAAWSAGFAALRKDFSPIDDHRASARYRTETAHALLGKALIEMAGTNSNRTRITGHREVA